MTDEPGNTAGQNTMHTLAGPSDFPTTRWTLVVAAAEFQKVLNPGIVGTDPIGVLAYLQLGRAFVLSGDRTKAKAAYEAFLALWKDADPGIPILKSAKAEYDRL